MVSAAFLRAVAKALRDRGDYTEAQLNSLAEGLEREADEQVALYGGFAAIPLGETPKRH